MIRKDVESRKIGWKIDLKAFNVYGWAYNLHGLFEISDEDFEPKIDRLHNQA